MQYKLGISAKVKILGWKKESELHQIYSQSRIFILSSVTAANGDKEGQGLVLQEAQAIYVVERIVLAWKADIAKLQYYLTVVDKDKNPLGFSYPQGNKPLDSGEVWQNILKKARYFGVSTSGNAISRKAIIQVFPIPDEYKIEAIVKAVFCIFQDFTYRQSLIAAGLATIKPFTWENTAE